MLLGIYLSADLVVSIHSYFAHEEQDVSICSVEEEANACHRTIYHNNMVTGCHHKTHLTSPIPKCELCSILHTRHVLPEHAMQPSLLVLYVPITPAFEDQLITNPICRTLSLRGPPSFSFYS